jgi:hypothetical protein
MVRVLRRLQVAEVSTVGKAAGVGTKIMFAKGQPMDISGELRKLAAAVKSTDDLRALEIATAAVAKAMPGGIGSEMRQPPVVGDDPAANAARFWAIVEDVARQRKVPKSVAADQVIREGGEGADFYVRSLTKAVAPKPHAVQRNGEPDALPADSDADEFAEMVADVMRTRQITRSQAQDEVVRSGRGRKLFDSLNKRCRAANG